MAAGCLCFSVSVAAAQGIWPENGFWPERAPYSARVTTDTPEYCAHLLSRIDQMRARVEEPAQRVDILAAQGRRLCASGHIRPGIARLRRALLLLQNLR